MQLQVYSITRCHVDINFADKNVEFGCWLWATACEFGYVIDCILGASRHREWDWISCYGIFYDRHNNGCRFLQDSVVIWNLNFVFAILNSKHIVLFSEKMVCEWSPHAECATMCVIMQYVPFVIYIFLKVTGEWFYLKNTICLLHWCIDVNSNIPVIVILLIRYYYYDIKYGKIASFGQYVINQSWKLRNRLWPVLCHAVISS